MYSRHSLNSSSDKHSLNWGLLDQLDIPQVIFMMEFKDLYVREYSSKLWMASWQY